MGQLTAAPAAQRSTVWVVQQAACSIRWSPPSVAACCGAAAVEGGDHLVLMLVSLMVLDL